jgi:hypothetical protein
MDDYWTAATCWMSWRDRISCDICRHYHMFLRLVFLCCIKIYCVITHKTSICQLHLYTVLQETQQTWLFLNRPTLKHVTFWWNYKDKYFFLWTYILTEIVFVTQLSSNGNFSLTNSVAYNKFLFHGQYIASPKPLSRFDYLLPDFSV